MRFERPEDIERETKAIETFVKIFGGSYRKLGEHDVDFKVFDKNDKLISMVEVKGRNRTISDAFPLPVAVRKLVKLSDTRINPVLIWACYDGIIYAKINELEGIIKSGGRTPRNGAAHDIEQMAMYYKDKNNFKIIKYDN